MPADNPAGVRDESLLDVIERLRADKYPDINRELVRELLRLHGEPAGTRDIAREIDELISAHVGD
jgi:hypothetical protein